MQRDLSDSVSEQPGAQSPARLRDITTVGVRRGVWRMTCDVCTVSPELHALPPDTPSCEGGLPAGDTGALTCLGLAPQEI